MSDAGLYPLYKLHLLDSALHDLKMQAANLDVGKAEAAQIKSLEADESGEFAAAKAVLADLKDKELEQKTLEEKVAKFEKQLFDGSVTSAKEIEHIQHEIEMLKGLSSSLDDKLLALMEEAPAAKAKVDGVEKELAIARQALATKQSEAKESHAEMQARYTAKGAERNALAKTIDESMLRQYEQIRKSTGSTAMATVTNLDRCSHCGMQVPEKAKDSIRSGRITTCESCKRILFIVMPEA